MNTIEITDLLQRQSKNCFNGVYACDKIPKNLTQNGALVCNTDPSNKPGRHWIVLFIGDNYIEFFDSLGNGPGYAPYPKEFLTAAKSRPTCEFNPHMIQSALSDTCGEFCVYYVRERCAGRAMHEIVADFQGRTPIQNDLLVKKLVSVQRGGAKQPGCQFCLPINQWV
jgi:hypothetical protein